jgi:hypothetical protein
LAHYAHPNDTPFGKNIFVRLLVVKIFFFKHSIKIFGFSISYFPFLLVIMDVINANSKSGFPIELLWYLETIIQVSCVFLVFPLFTVYYEGNEEDNFVITFLCLF